MADSTEDLLSDDDAADSTNEDIEKIKVAVSNERNCPELLTFAGQLVEDLQEMIQSQQTHIDKAREGTDEEEHFAISFYQMEIDRVKYLLASYLRLRLRKIERLVFHVMGDEDEFDKLSSHEATFAGAYMEAVQAHMGESFLQSIPAKFASLTDAGVEGVDMVARPKLDGFVFCRVTKDLGEVDMDERGEQVSVLNEGDTHVLRYRPIRQLVEEGSINLV